jgi:hypothetical protein
MNIRRIYNLSKLSRKKQCISTRLSNRMNSETIVWARVPNYVTIGLQGVCSKSKFSCGKICCYSIEQSKSTSIKCVPCDLILNSIFATPETLIVSLLANLISEHSNRSNDRICCYSIEQSKSTCKTVKSDK